MADMEHKIGKVVINPWLLMEKRHGFNSDNNIEGSLRCFTTAMEESLERTDRSVEIIRIDNGYYRAFFPDDEYYDITDDMILGYAFKYGQEIEVKEMTGDWRKRIFLALVPGAEKVTHCISNGHEERWREGKTEVYSCNWLHARPIQEEAEKDIIDIKFTLNGKSIEAPEFLLLTEKIKSLQAIKEGKE